MRLLILTTAHLMSSGFENSRSSVARKTSKKEGFWETSPQLAVCKSRAEPESFVSVPVRDVLARSHVQKQVDTII